MKKVLFATCAASLLAGIAGAGTPTYAYLGTVDLGPHPTAGRATSVCTDGTNGVYFTDNSTDNVYHVPDLLATMGQTTDATNVPLVGIRGFGGGSSWMNVSYDSANNVVYASGRTSTGPANITVKIANTGVGTYSMDDITGISGEASGGVVVGSNALAFADYTTGAVQFYSVSGTVASASGSPIAGAGGVVSSIAYAPALSKIFFPVSTVSQTSQTNVFTSDGTAGGTSYSGGANPVVAAVASDLTTANYNYAYNSVGVDDADQVLAVPAVKGAAGTPAAAFGLVDLESGSTSLTPYATFDGTTTGDGPWVAATNPMAFAFVTISTEKYLVVGGRFGSSGTTGKLHVFQKVTASNVGDWTSYN